MCLNSLFCAVIFSNNIEYLILINLMLFFPSYHQTPFKKNTFTLSKIVLSPSETFLEQLFPFFLLLVLQQKPQLNQFREECQIIRRNHGIPLLATHLVL